MLRVRDWKTFFVGFGIVALLLATMVVSVTSEQSPASSVAGWCPTPSPTLPPEVEPRSFLPLVLSSGNDSGECVPECTESNDDPFHTCLVLKPDTWCGELSPYDDVADWYELNLSCAFTLTLNLDGPNSGDVNFDLYVYGDPPGNPLAWGNSPGADETLSVFIGPGRYYVVPTSVQGNGAYELAFGQQMQ